LQPADPGDAEREKKLRELLADEKKDDKPGHLRLRPLPRQSRQRSPRVRATGCFRPTIIGLAA